MHERGGQTDRQDTTRRHTFTYLLKAISSRF